MRLSSMGQLAAAVKESFNTITIDRHTEDNSVNNVQPPVQNRYIDSVEFSDRALELYMDTGTETNFKAEFGTDRRQKENPDTNHQKQEEQPAPTRAVSLNVLA